MVSFRKDRNRTVEKQKGYGARGQTWKLNIVKKETKDFEGKENCPFPSVTGS